MLDEERERTEAYPGPLDLPDEHDSPAEDGGPTHSLTDDIAALIDDGKTYVEAEIAYQKSRGAFVASHAKRAAIFGLGAFGVFHLALIAATVGAVIALVPLVGAWAATAIVTVALVIIGVVLVRIVKQRIDDIAGVFSEHGK